MFATANGVMEELAYRGALLAWTARVTGVWAAVVAQAVVFGLAHGSASDVGGSPIVLMVVLGVGGFSPGSSRSGRARCSCRSPGTWRSTCRCTRTWAVGRPDRAKRAGRAIIGSMTQRFARVPVDAEEVVRQVRGLGGVPWARLWGYLRPQLVPFSVALVGLLIGSLAGLAFPLVIAGITTQVVAGGDPAGLDRLVVLLVALFFIQAVGGFVQTWLLGVVGERVVAQLRGELYGRLVTLSLDFYGQHRVGELISRLSSDVTLVRTMLTQTVTSLLSSVIALVGSVIILFTLSPTLLLVVLLLAPALIVVAIVFGRPLQRISTMVQDMIARSTTTAEEVLSGIRVVKSYVREDWELRRYDADLEGIVGAGSRLALWRAGFGALMGLLGFGAVALLLWYTGHQVIDGTLGIGTLTGFLLYGIAIGASLGNLASLYGQFREGTGAVQRVFEIIDTRPTILDRRRCRPDRPGRRSDQARGRHVRIRPRSAGRAERGSGDRGRGEPRPGRAVRFGQDHARGAHPPPVGRGCRCDTDRWPRYPRRHRGQSPRADRARGAGGDVVRRVDPRQHPVRPPRGDRC